MKLQRLLVVIDTEHAEQPALLRAAELARQTGAELHLDGDVKDLIVPEDL